MRGGKGARGGDDAQVGENAQAERTRVVERNRRLNRTVGRRGRAGEEDARDEEDVRSEEGGRGGEAKRARGAKIIGPAVPNEEDPRGEVDRARLLGEEDGTVGFRHVGSVVWGELAWLRPTKKWGAWAKVLPGSL